MKNIKKKVIKKKKATKSMGTKQPYVKMGFFFKKIRRIKIIRCKFVSNRVRRLPRTTKT